MKACTVGRHICTCLLILLKGIQDFGSCSRLGCLAVSMEFPMIQQPVFVTVHRTGGNSACLTDYLKPFTVNKDP